MSDSNPYVAWEGPADDDEVGAFAVQGDVTWNTGFGDEDLAGASPTRVQTAPRPPSPNPAAPSVPATPQVPTVPAPVVAAPTIPAPAAPTAPAPYVPSMPAPAAPAPALTGDTEVPSWAQHRPAEQPTPQPAPAPAPAAPAPARADLSGDVDVPPWAQHRPAEQPTPQPTPWEEPLPGRPGTEPPAQVTPPLPVPPQQPDPASQPVYALPEPEPEQRRGRRTKKASGAGKPAKGTGPAKSANLAGGRWKVKAIRALVFSVLGLLLLGGLKNVIVPSDTPDTEEIATSVRTALGDTGFPVAAGEGFALRFASVYLNYDPNTEEARTQVLQQYSPEAADATWGWTGSTGKQKVVAGPVVAAKATVKDKHFATVTVAAQVSSGSWVYLAVPLYASERGALVVSGPPAFVAPPARASSPGQDGITERDSDLEATLTTDVLPGFFKAWAASNAVELNRYTAKDATPAATTGLAAAMTLGQVSTVAMPKEGDVRVGRVEVQWNLPGAGTYTQAYQVTVTRDASDKWSVKDVAGGVISDTATKGDEGVVGPDPSATPTG